MNMHLYPQLCAELEDRLVLLLFLGSNIKCMTHGTRAAAFIKRNPHSPFDVYWLLTELAWDKY